MKTINTYIKEAFITKANIKQISQQANDKKDRWYFLPFTKRICSTAKFEPESFDYIEEFSTYEELVQIVTNSEFAPNYIKDNIKEVYITDIATVETLDDDVFNAAPDEYKESFKNSYLLYVYIKRPFYARQGDYLVGYVNCDDDAIKETINKK
jgi:hypothetical protein